MEELLNFARGPLFKLSFLIMALGLLRHLFLIIFEMIRAVKRSADPVPPYSPPLYKLAIRTLSWLIPFKHLRNRPFYSIISIIFHIGLIIVPLFLLAHIQLWQKGMGISWPAISDKILDILTLTTIAAGILLFIGRISSRDSRYISRPQDYILNWLLILPFISGYFVMHPHLLPFSYTLIMTVHVLSAEFVFILIPFSKIVHCILYPLVHFASNFAWRMVPGGGEKVARSLGKEIKV